MALIGSRAGRWRGGSAATLSVFHAFTGVCSRVPSHPALFGDLGAPIMSVYPLLDDPRFNGSLPVRGTYPAEKILDEGIVFERVFLVLLAHGARIALAPQSLRASFIFKRLCSIPKATNSIVRALRRL